MTLFPPTLRDAEADAEVWKVADSKDYGHRADEHVSNESVFCTLGAHAGESYPAPTLSTKFLPLVPFSIGEQVIGSLISAAIKKVVNLNFGSGICI